MHNVVIIFRCVIPSGTQTPPVRVLTSLPDPRAWWPASSARMFIKIGAHELEENDAVMIILLHWQVSSRLSGQ
jgi:hypothetical protein